MLLWRSNPSPPKLVQKPVRPERPRLPKDRILDQVRFKEIFAIILNVNPASGVRLDEFRLGLVGMLIAVGVCDDHSRYTRAFREYAAKQPDHADLARQFEAIAVAENPLDPSVSSRIALSELNNAARRKWFQRKLERPHPLRGVIFELLTEAEQADVNKMATGLADFHQSQIRAYRPNKDTLDTILEQLGDLYASVIGFDGHRHDLPHSRGSRFVTLCQLVVQPFFDPSETTKVAISNRLQRVKERARRPKKFARKQRRLKR